jgi:serine/threonine protein kinase
MKDLKTIFDLFETEPIQNNLPTESNHFIKEKSKDIENEQNKNICESSFVSTSLNYFKDTKHGGDDYFMDETDNECGSNFVSRKELQNIIYKNSVYKESDFIKISKLGNGSYGQVFKVKHKETNKIYALKEINKPKLIKENKAYQMYVENEMLKLCSHKNIVNYYGFYENKYTFSIIEEYCPYGDLSSFLNENKQNLSLSEIQYIIGQIILCLEYLSTKKIIHRDIKPENFLITDNFTLKLIDFGTATLLGKIFDIETNKFIVENYKNDIRQMDSFIKNPNYNREHELNSNESPCQSFQYKITDILKYLAYPFFDLETEKNESINKFEKIKQQTFAGTAEYMAPEIINSKKIGYYTDMWSVICILFLCFTGNKPFTDKTEYLIFQNISNIKINEQNIELIPDEALNLIKNFFKKEPSERIGYNGIKDFDFNLIKSHPFFQIKDDNLTIEQIRQSLMSKCSYFKKLSMKNNNNYLNTVKLNNLNNSKNYNYKNKFEESKNSENETIIKSGLLKKQSPYYYYDLRKIILYDTPRIDYIDPERSIIKGRINLTKECYAQLVKSNQFKLYTPKRTFVFMCKERYNISPWVSAINHVIEKYA